jgi:protein gp37
MRDWDADPQGWIRKPAGEWERGEHGVDWVIVGGESGPRARPMHPDWARSLRDQCKAAGVPFFFKQHGEWTWDDQLLCDGLAVEQAFPTSNGPIRVGKKAAGRSLDGVEYNEFPQERDNDFASR